MNDLILNLTILLNEMNITVKSLEERANLKRGTIQNILSGKSINPTMKTLLAIAKIANISIDELVGNKVSVKENKNTVEDEFLFL